MLLTVGAQIVCNDRCVAADLPALLFLAVKYAQRILIQSFPACGTELVFPVLKICYELFPERRPAFGTSDRIYVELKIADTDILQNVLCKRYCLGVYIGL